MANEPKCELIIRGCASLSEIQPIPKLPSNSKALEYVVNAIKLGWLENWKNNSWKGSDKKSVKNIELWQELDNLLNIHNVNFNKVKGHSDNELNNRCDELATGEIAKHLNI